MPGGFWFKPPLTLESLVSTRLGGGCYVTRQDSQTRVGGIHGDRDTARPRGPGDQYLPHVDGGVEGDGASIDRINTRVPCRLYVQIEVPCLCALLLRSNKTTLSPLLVLKEYLCEHHHAWPHAPRGVNM